MNSSLTSAQYLELEGGFYSMENKIIQSRSYLGDFAMPGTDWSPEHDLCGGAVINNNMICFFDTNLKTSSSFVNNTICSSEAAYEYLLEKTGNQLKCIACGGSLNPYVYSTNSALTSAYNGWYKAATEIEYCACYDCNSPQQHGYPQDIGVVSAPVANWQLTSDYSTGTITGQPSSAKKQFTLPVIDISQLSCTENIFGEMRQPVNEAGAYTRCGNDLDNWLAVNVPKPPGFNMSPNAKCTSQCHQAAVTRCQKSCQSEKNKKMGGRNRNHMAKACEKACRHDKSKKMRLGQCRARCAAEKAHTHAKKKMTKADKRKRKRNNVRRNERMNRNRNSMSHKKNKHGSLRRRGDKN